MSANPLIQTKPYSVIDANGRVVSYGRALEPPAVDGCAVIESEAPSLSHYREADAWVAIPTQPSRHHVFDWVTKEWTDARTLQDLQATKWAEIKRHRDDAEFAPFTYNAMEFDGDLNAQRRLGSYISVSKSALAAGDPFSAEFILADNTVVTLSAQDFVGIELAKVQAVAAAFAHATALRSQIEAATTVAEVDAVTW